MGCKLVTVQHNEHSVPVYPYSFAAQQLHISWNCCDKTCVDQCMYTELLRLYSLHFTHLGACLNARCCALRSLLSRERLISIIEWLWWYSWSTTYEDLLGTSRPFPKPVRLPVRVCHFNRKCSSPKYLIFSWWVIFAEYTHCHTSLGSVSFLLGLWVLHLPLVIFFVCRKWWTF